MYLYCIDCLQVVGELGCVVDWVYQCLCYGDGGWWWCSLCLVVVVMVENNLVVGGECYGEGDENLVFLYDKVFWSNVC